VSKEQQSAIYFSEDKIKKLKSEDTIFREEIKKTENRVIARYLEARIIPTIKQDKK
jgi:hypothetical protein